MDIETCRNEINSIDAEIAALLKRRFELTDMIGEYKAKNGLPVLSESREAEVLNRVASVSGADCSEDVKAIYFMLLGRSRQRQNRLFCGDK